MAEKRHFIVESSGIRRMRFLFARVVASLLMWAAAWPGRAAGAGSAGQDTPNIIVIVADDLGYGDLGCYGNSANRTPHLDRMATRGMRFTDFYANGPLCSPTRAALLTGRYQQRAGIEDVLSGAPREEGGQHESGMRLAEITIAEVLKKSGYRTGAVGKWHLGYQAAFGPIRQGFDWYRGNLSGDSDYFAHVDRWGRPDWWHDETLVAENGYSTDLMTTYAIRFIEEQREHRFFLYLPCLAIHFPYQGPDDAAVRKRGVPVAAGENPRGPRKDEKQAVAEMIGSLDGGVGRIMACLEDLGLAGNTLIFFMSDNGGYRSASDNGPFRGEKKELLEGGIRVPAIAYWPGHIPAGVVNCGLAMSMDLFPTLTELAGAGAVDAPALDGLSLVPTVLGGKPIPDRTLFWRYLDQSAVRRGNWKWLTKGGKEHLYDLGEDPGEANDLLADHGSLARELATAFLVWESAVTAGVDWIGRPPRNSPVGQPSHQ